MKYNRYIYILREMGYELINKFIEEYGLLPELLSEDNIPYFNGCMCDFLEKHKDIRGLQNLCKLFPELENVPHPDEIPEDWNMNPSGREVLKLAYIEKIENENKKIKEENQELKNLNQELKNQIDEISNETGEPEGKAVHIMQNEENSDNLIAADIYKKFFVPPIAKNRYHLLSIYEISWIKAKAGLSDTEINIFELCCNLGSLKDVAEKTGMNLSKVKHTSSAVIKKIKFCCGSKTSEEK